VIKEEFNKGVMGYVQTMTDSKKCHEKAVKAHDTRLTRGNDIATINKKKADDLAVNEFGMVPALPSQKIAVFCPNPNCDNEGTTQYTYDHDGETKIVVPQCNKQPRGGKRCQKTMKPKKTPTPLPTISQPNVRLIENEVSVNVHFVLNFALVCFTFCTQCSFSYVAYLSHFAITQKKKVLSRYHLGQFHYLKPFSERC